MSFPLIGRDVSGADAPATRIDLHLHSRAYTDTGSWLLSPTLMPESFVDPAETYAACKRRGMDRVTLTDHNTISGALAIAHHPDVIIGLEITAFFPDDGVPMHVLAWGIDEPLWGDLDRARANIVDLVDLLDERRVPCALAHPLRRVCERLSVDHLEQCLLLFRLWEGRRSGAGEPPGCREVPRRRRHRPGVAAMVVGRRWRRRRDRPTRLRTPHAGRRTDAGARLDMAMRGLTELGLQADGFIAPAYAHPTALTAALCARRLGWWATRTRLHRDGSSRRLWAVGLGASTASRRITSPAAARSAVRLARPLAAVRLDLHAADLAHSGLRHAVAALICALLADGRHVTTHAALVASTCAPVRVGHR